MLIPNFHKIPQPLHLPVAPLKTFIDVSFLLQFSHFAVNTKYKGISKQKVDEVTII